MRNQVNVLHAVTVFLALLGLLSQAPPARPAEEPSGLRGEIETLKEGQEQIRKELEEIKKLLEPLQRKQPEPFKEAMLTLDGPALLGDENAKVTVVEFTDYQCPFCARHSQSVLPSILKDYVETGKVRYVVREFPLKSIHPAAAKASEAALCAGDQGKYWEMHGRLFANPRALSMKDLMGHGKSLDLELEKFQQCLEGNKYAQRVEADLTEGAKAGVRGTPSFFLGLSDPEKPDKLKATQFLRGAQPYQRFQQAIDSLLASEDDSHTAALRNSR